MLISQENVSTLVAAAVQSLGQVVFAKVSVQNVEFTDCECLLPQVWFTSLRCSLDVEASFSSTARSRGFNVTVEEVIEDGRSNIREILHITWPEVRPFRTCLNVCWILFVSCATLRFNTSLV